LNRMQFLRVSRQRCNGTHLHGDAPSKGHDQHSRFKSNAMTHLGAFKGVDQTALADIREADGDALGRARFVRLEEAKQRRCGSRGEAGAPMRARGAAERWGCVAEVFELCLGILARHQIYKDTRAKPCIMLTTIEAQRVY
jgi:hypothetical protein